MENKKITLEELRMMILKNIIRVLKNHKVYPLFRLSIGPAMNPYFALPYKSLIRDRLTKNTNDNIFKGTCTVDNILRIMEKVEKRNSTIDPSNQYDMQRLVMEHVNNILHCCVERGVKDVSIMEVLGKESFEMTCKRLFGDDFVDETNNQDEEFLSRQFGDVTSKMLKEGHNIQEIMQNPFIRALFEESRRRHFLDFEEVNRFEDANREENFDEDLNAFYRGGDYDDEYEEEYEDEDDEWI